MSLAGRVRVMTDDFGQGAYSVRMEWGLIGAQACAADVSLVAHHNRRCSWGLKPPVSSSDLAM